MMYAIISNSHIKQIKRYDLNSLCGDESNLKALSAIEMKVTQAILPVRERLLSKLSQVKVVSSDDLSKSVETSSTTNLNCGKNHEYMESFTCFV